MNTKLNQFIFSIIFFFLITTGLFAQEHFTTNSVRIVSMYRTNPGQFDAYMKYLRANFLPQQEEAKKQGLILDYSILLNTPSSPDDWDIAVVVVHKNFGDALDYNQSDADKRKEIMSKHYKTTDEDKMREMTANRFEMRTYIGTKYFRDVTLKPLQ